MKSLASELGLTYYMASPVNGQDEPNRVLWLAHEQARLSYLAHSGLPAISCEKNFIQSQIINPFLTKNQNGWVLVSLFLRANGPQLYLGI